eukprot:7154952-Pyramimonas_sp.AAC.1
MQRAIPSAIPRVSVMLLRALCKWIYHPHRETPSDAKRLRFRSTKVSALLCPGPCQAPPVPLKAPLW